ncbi:MbnP family protein [Dyadobacter crusticola]|uniref:MbnP family protein n=1 Tax=Dyadobacter crusticola TaxID=292407 RepID=UPI0004E242D7|nr:MbnP family protein [Dyadobacter crusticola]
MKKYFSVSAAITFLALALFQLSCSNDDEPTVATGSVVVHFNNMVGNEDLALNSGNYINAAGEDFTVTKLNYYISNIKFTKADGSGFTVPKDSSYFLIREANEASQTIRINNVPVGNYTGIEYVVGIDSLKSIEEPENRKGILDIYTGPTNEETMYWNWNPGYIFLKMEGASDFATTSNGKYQYHIGGFGGRTAKTLNNLKNVKLNFNAQATVTTSISPQVYIKADILKIFDGPIKLSIAKNSGVMYEPVSADIASNYGNMFSIKEVRTN